MLDCLLINSPDQFYSSHYTADPKMPLGLLYIASFLIGHGFTVKIIDCHTNSFTESEVIEVVGNYEPRLIGLNATTPNRRVVFGLVKALKEKYPATPVVAGGPHATSFPEDFFIHCPEIDGVAIGEGEQTILAILDSLPKIDGLPGIYTQTDFRLKNQRRYAERINNLDRLPFPNFDLVELEKYLQVSPELYLTCSRGCRYDCAFCSVRTLLGRAIEFRSATNVIEEMKQLHAKYNVNKFYFYDDDLATWPQLASFCASNAETGLRWTAQATLNDIKAEDVKTLAHSGCYRLSFGFESGSYKIQKYVGKVIKERAINLLPMFKSQGIITRGYFIIGFPQETVEDVADTLMYILRLKSLGLGDTAIFPARPYPGTRLFTECLNLFGESRVDELLDFYYVDDYKLHDNQQVKDKLHRYNTLPSFQINSRFTSQQIRKFITLAFEISCDPTKYGGLTRTDILGVLHDELAQVV